MIRVQLPTGKTISVSVYEYYFLMKEEEIDLFFQSCIADDIGTFIEDPFSDRSARGRIELDEDLPLDDLLIEHPDLDIDI